MTEPAGAPPDTAWPCLSVHDGAVWLAVSVSPNARRTQAEALHDGALRVRLAAPPVDGKANELLLAWLAGELDLPRRAVRLVRGETARRKWLAVDATQQRLAEWLQERVGGPPSGA